MKSLWNATHAKKLGNNLLKQRVYTSRLLGQNEDLVMHGGGNTSVKINVENIFGQKEEILFVKGSGWDLATIEAPGFAPVKLNELKKLAELPHLSDVDMVRYQRMAMTDPSAPNPSVEAILHAIIPYIFVDHTHADAVVTITNTPGGKAKIQEIYGNKILIIPYVMPGFILAKKIHEMTRKLDWSTIEGMILMNHGVFTFHDNAKECYEKMIGIVSKAEQYLKKKTSQLPKARAKKINDLYIPNFRKELNKVSGKAFIVKLNNSPSAIAFSNLNKAKRISNKGPLTPDHIIRTKRTPVFLSNNSKKSLEEYTQNYLSYFEKYNKGETMLDPAPRWAIYPGSGTLSIGNTPKSVAIVEDISNHTMNAIYKAEQMGGWKTLSQRNLFEMEYWSLEQAKLKKSNNTKPLQGRIALITGAASGIGAACVENLVSEGAVVVALDINPIIKNKYKDGNVLGIVCDILDKKELQSALSIAIRQFGGLDMIVSNAGIFPPSASIENIEEKIWDSSLEINLSSHRRLLQHCIPFLKLGIKPSIVFVGSKNVPAPGPGAAAYSAAKAGLNQLARIAAMELGEYGIRVNTVHPNAVYDTRIWTEKVLQERAEHYGLTVDEYKSNNILKTEVSSTDVAKLVAAILGDTFSKTTGAQIPIDGGNERVI